MRKYCSAHLSKNEQIGSNEMKILLAEDDTFLANGLALVLRDSGFAVDQFDDGDEADIAISTTAYDLLILDIGLPGMNGLDLLKKLRMRGDALPVLILSARDQVQDRVKGLDAGANDYLIKPFHMTELEARIRALLRKQWDNKHSIKLMDLEFDTSSRTASIKGELLELAPRELDVLEMLLKNRGKIVSKERLIEQLSSWDTELSFNALDITVHRLRKKLTPSGVTVKTLRRIGYVLD